MLVRTLESWLSDLLLMYKVRDKILIIIVIYIFSLLRILMETGSCNSGA